MRLHCSYLASLLVIPLSFIVPKPAMAQATLPPAGNIARFAGNYSYRSEAIPDDLYANAAAFRAPDGLAMDKDGNLYIADKADHLVRKVDIAGKVTIIAGTPGTPGPGVNEEGIPATSAHLNEPISVAVDAAGTVLYIADYSNHLIRKVDLVSPTHPITTFAGNGQGPLLAPPSTGSNPAFMDQPTDDIGEGVSPTVAPIDPHSVSVDALGNVYIADQTHRVIRKVGLDGKTITTVAGIKNMKGYLSTAEDGPATSMPLDTPKALAFDKDGNLYIADQYGERIFKVDATTQHITTFAGDGIAATDTAAPNGDGGSPVTAQLNAPAGLATDASGNVYITDQADFRIRKVDVTDPLHVFIATVAGNGVAVSAGGDGTPLPEDNGLAINAALNSYAAGIVVSSSNFLYIADFGNTVVRVVNLAKVQSVQVTLQSDVANTTFTVSGNATACEVGGPYPAGKILNWTPHAACKVTVNPPTSYSFNSWSDNSTDNPHTFDVSSDTPYTAHLAVNPSACTFTVPPGDVLVSALAADGGVNVTTNFSGCNWTAASNAPWLITNASGSSTGTAPFHATANSTSSLRTGTLTIANQSVTVNQAAASCSYTLSATTAGFSASAADGGVNVRSAVTGCNWTASSDSPWLTVTSGAMGTDNGSVSLHVDANSGTSVRTGTITVAGQAFSVTQAGTAVAVPAGLRFVPVTPCRIADTRDPDGRFGGPVMGGQTTRDFAIPQSNCPGIPAEAQAFSLNFTVVPTDKLSWITVFPTGQPKPLASTLNSFDGRVKANAAIVPAGTNGSVSVFATDSTQLIIDINGYFVPASNPSALAFFPMAPCRIADTRDGGQTLGMPAMVGQQERVFPVLASSCQIPATAQAYSLNYTVVPKRPLGYLTTWPTGKPRPLVSTLNAPTGSITANAAIVPAGDNGDLSVYVTDDTELIIDINGYFAPPANGGLSLYNLAPCRVYDTREASGGHAMVNTLGITVAGTCNTPASAQSYIFNTTVVPTDALLYLTLWPHGVGDRPTVSALNAPDGAVTSNMAIVRTSDGSVNAFAHDSTHLILDIFGYFAP